MGRASRWLKGIFGINPPSKTHTPSNSGRRKIPNSFAGNLCNNPATIPPNITPSEVAWLKSYYSDSEEQSKHAIAVAAATAAAADAAVIAAQAAVAVVRLTSRGRNLIFSDNGCCGAGERGPEKLAAVKIQTAFRGYLARKALRALKGLVKIQALVRGYLVRKQATITLHGMEALFRAQATVRFKRAQPYTSHSNNIRSRKSTEILDDNKSEQASEHSRRLSTSFESRNSIIPIIEDIPKIVEMDPGRPRSWDHDPYYLPRLSVPICHHHCPNITNLGLLGHECGVSSAQSTPRFTNPGTPSRSVCGDNVYYSRRCENYPNYMAKTHLFRAKLRSQSAPKHRPDHGPNKRMSLSDTIESRNSLSGGRMERSCSQAQEAINFKNVIMGKFIRSQEYAREPQRYHL